MTQHCTIGDLSLLRAVGTVCRHSSPTHGPCRYSGKDRRPNYSAILSHKKHCFVPFNVPSRRDLDAAAVI
jgi:hypothetical protein